MGVGRILSAAATAVAVCGCAVVAVTMARTAPEPHRAADKASLPTVSTSRTPAGYRVITPAPRPPSSAATSSVSTSTSTSTSAGADSTRPVSPTTPTSTPATRSTHATPPAQPSSAAAPWTTSPPRTSSTSSAPKPSPTRSPTSAPRPAPKPSGTSLPLPNFATGDATRVVTVVASSTSSTTATLQAWDKAPGWGWFKHGAAVTAHIGSQGMTYSPAEWKSATPIGSFTLTRAFGRYSDPGTPLPYTQTAPSDWWISQSGSLYNTFQRCPSGCGFTQGSPNEHLYYETPYYNYAVVIDYNTRNAGTVRQGAGSAFFLHVSVGSATAGCVAVPQDYLVSLMRWLSPSAHPRILIGAP